MSKEFLFSDQLSMINFEEKECNSFVDDLNASIFDKSFKSSDQQSTENQHQKIVSSEANTKFGEKGSSVSTHQGNNENLINTETNENPQTINETSHHSSKQLKTKNEQINENNPTKERDKEKHDIESTPDEKYNTYNNKNTYNNNNFKPINENNPTDPKKNEYQTDLQQEQAHQPNPTDANENLNGSNLTRDNLNENISMNKSTSNRDSLKEFADLPSNFNIVPEILNTTADLTEYLSKHESMDKWVVPNNQVISFVCSNSKAPDLMDHLRYDIKSYLHLMNAINNAQANDVIRLPNELIVINDLLIKKPLKIIGGPDTILWIKNGSIRISFDPRQIESKHKVTFCECKIMQTNEVSIQALVDSETINIKDNEQRSDDENISINKVPQSKSIRQEQFNTHHTPSTQEPFTNSHNLYKSSHAQALFTLESHSKLELQDCYITSEADCGKIQAVQSNQENLNQRTQVNSSKMSINRTQRSFYQLNRTRIQNQDSFNDYFQSEVSLYSCMISGFHSVIAAGPGTCLSINNSHFSNCKGNAITLKTPLDCSITGSTIELAKKNGICIKSISTNYDIYNQKISDMITIEGCDVSKNKLNGFVLLGDAKAQSTENNMSMNVNKTKQVSQHENVPVAFQTNLLLSISCSRIRQNCMNGIVCKNIALKCVQILQSDVGINAWDNLCFKNVRSCDSELLTKGVTCLGIICNRLFDSKHGHGISLIESQAFLVENNEIQHNQLCGIQVIGKEKNKFDQKDQDENVSLQPMILNQLSISKNGESGVLLQDQFPEGVLIHDSKVQDNRLDGVAIIQRGSQQVPNPQQANLNCVEIINTCTSFLNKKEHIRPHVIKVSNSEIHNNGMSGIYLIKSPVIIYDVVILDNKEFAVHIPEEGDKKQLALVYDGQVDCQGIQTNNIHGLVGGSYGEAKILRKEKVCSNNICFM